MYNNNYSKIIPYISANTKYISDAAGDINFIDIDNNTIKISEFNDTVYAGIDRDKLLSPSFLMLFKNYGGELSLEKFSDYTSIMNGESLYGITEEELMVYGKLYYEDSGESKVRTISYRLVK
jgi:hypothetical protein